MKHVPVTLAAAAFAVTSSVAADGLSHLPLLADIVPDAVAISPHVPQMGTHWAEPANLPLGPIYCEIEGRIVCVEYMFLASELADGVNWKKIPTGIQTPPLTHIDMDYKPDGVGPFQEPLYQIHFYFADTDVLAAH